LIGRWNDASVGWKKVAVRVKGIQGGWVGDRRRLLGFRDVYTGVHEYIFTLVYAQVYISVR